MDKEAEDRSWVTDVSPRALTCVVPSEMPCRGTEASRERLAIFRKRAVESFGNMPECGHNWARDPGNANFR
jgi:hypothetical protein